MKNVFMFVLILFVLSSGIECTTEEDEGVKYADKCEGLTVLIFFYINWLIVYNNLKFYLIFAVCKVVAIELQSKLDETGKTNDALEIGYSVDDVAPKKKIDYKKS